MKRRIVAVLVAGALASALVACTKRRSPEPGYQSECSSGTSYAYWYKDSKQFKNFEDDKRARAAAKADGCHQIFSVAESEEAAGKIYACCQD